MYLSKRSPTLATSDGSSSLFNLAIVQTESWDRVSILCQTISKTHNGFGNRGSGPVSSISRWLSQQDQLIHSNHSISPAYLPPKYTNIRIPHKCPCSDWRRHSPSRQATKRRTKYTRDIWTETVSTRDMPTMYSIWTLQTPSDWINETKTITKPGL